MVSRIAESPARGLSGILISENIRNLDRFPEDFMFPLTKEESSSLKFHLGTSSWGDTRKLPRAITEQGVAMLSGILRSNRAFSVDIEIMGAFVRMRQMLATHANLESRLNWKGNTMPGSKWFSTPSANSWPRLPRLRKKSGSRCRKDIKYIEKAEYARVYKQGKRETCDAPDIR
jgi:hypothetical protein